MTQLPFALPYIRWADIAVLTAPAVVSERSIYDHEFVYVVGGEGTIAINGMVHPATHDRLFLIQPRARHSFSPAAGKELHLLGVHFDWVPQHDTLSFPIFTPAAEPVKESKFRQPQELPGWKLSELPYVDVQSPLIRHSFEAVVDAYNLLDEHSRALASSLLTTTILRITREIREMHLRRQSTLVGADALRRSQRARVLLEEASPLYISVEAAAAQVGWSSDHLRRIFRQVYETSPAKIQMKARLRRARQLLRHEDRPISEIGQMCGFEDASHFARVFKNHTSITPYQHLCLVRRR